MVNFLVYCLHHDLYRFGFILFSSKSLISVLLSARVPLVLSKAWTNFCLFYSVLLLRVFLFPALNWNFSLFYSELWKSIKAFGSLGAEILCSGQLVVEDTASHFELSAFVVSLIVCVTNFRYISHEEEED